MKFCLLEVGEPSIKFKSKQRCWQIKCWDDCICSGMLICDNIGREEGHSSSYKLNIIDEFFNGFKSISNSIYKNNTSS